MWVCILKWATFSVRNVSLDKVLIINVIWVSVPWFLVYKILLHSVCVCVCGGVRAHTCIFLYTCCSLEVKLRWHHLEVNAIPLPLGSLGLVPSLILQGHFILHIFLDYPLWNSVLIGFILCEDPESHRSQVNRKNISQLVRDLV